MPNSPVEKIKERLNIVEVIQGYIKLKKAGANYRAKCPFHSDSDPSFYVSPEKQIWHCFGCDAGGDVFEFVKEIEGVEFREALRILANQAGVELKRVDPKVRSKKEKIFNILDKAADFYHQNLLNNKKQLDYLSERGLNKKSIKEFKLGYAPDNWRELKSHLLDSGHKEEDIVDAGVAIKPGQESKASSCYDRFRARIIFPIASGAGQIVGFSGRIIPEKEKETKAGKYINTPSTLVYDKSKVLYGLNKAKVDIRKLNHVVLTEGNLDVVMSHQAGVKNTIATSGTSLTRSHLEVIKRYTPNIKLAFDFDQAGKEAVKRGVKEALRLGMNVKIITSSKAEDPAELIKKDAEKWIEACKNAQNYVGYFFKQTFEGFQADDVESKKRIAAEILPMIKAVQNSIERSHWLQKLSEQLGIDESYLEEALAKSESAAKNQNYSSASTPDSSKKSRGRPANPTTRKQLLEKELLALFLEFQEKLQDILDSIETSLLEESPRQEILKHLKAASSKKESEFPEEYKDQIKILKFRTEFMSFSKDEDIKKEVKSIIKELKRDRLRKNIKKLSSQIKRFESQNKEEKLNQALKKHSKLTQKLNKLE